jgi:hypothetical protein
MEVEKKVIIDMIVAELKKEDPGQTVKVEKTFGDIHTDDLSIRLVRAKDYGDWELSITKKYLLRESDDNSWDYRLGRKVPQMHVQVENFVKEVSSRKKEKVFYGEKKTESIEELKKERDRLKVLIEMLREIINKA